MFSKNQAARCLTYCPLFGRERTSNRDREIARVWITATRRKTRRFCTIFRVVGPEPVRLKEIGALAADKARDLRSLKPELNPMMPHMSDDGQGRILAKCFASKRCRGCMLAFGEIC